MVVELAVVILESVLEEAAEATPDNGITVDWSSMRTAVAVMKVRMPLCLADWNDDVIDMNLP